MVIETIRSTTTTTGLTVKAELDLGTYEKGIKSRSAWVAQMGCFRVAAGLLRVTLVGRFADGPGEW